MHTSFLNSFKPWLSWKHKTIFVLLICLITSGCQFQLLEPRFKLLKELLATILSCKPSEWAESTG